MATLEDLNLNRFLYRRRANESSDVLQNYMTQSQSGNGGGSSSTNGPLIPPGTIVQSAIWQSSGSDQRIEINPNDTLVAYRNGVPVGILNRDGFTSFSGSDRVVNIDRNSLTAYKPNGDVLFEVYPSTPEILVDDVEQPVVYYGSVDASGAMVASNFTPGISCVKASTGVYNITMPQTLTAPVSWIVTCSPTSGHFRCRVTNKTTTGFTITWQESNYSSGLYTGEVAVDVAFDFQVTRTLY